MNHLLLVDSWDVAAIVVDSGSKLLPVDVPDVVPVVPEEPDGGLEEDICADDVASDTVCVLLVSVSVLLVRVDGQVTVVVGDAEGVTDDTETFTAHKCSSQPFDACRLK